MVAAPSSSVSARPRMFSRRSVKTWPRSRSAASWISSMATKGDVEVARHRLDGRDPEARVRRLDLLLAGDQRHRVRRRRGRRRAGRPRAPAGAAAGRSCRRRGRACARWRGGSCRCWSGPSTAVTPRARMEGGSERGSIETPNMGDCAGRERSNRGRGIPWRSPATQILGPERAGNEWAQSVTRDSLIRSDYGASRSRNGGASSAPASNWLLRSDSSTR